MQTPQSGSRKRPAPGTSPMIRRSQQPQQQTNMNPPSGPDASQLTDDQFLSWGANNGIASYSDPTSGYPTNIYPSGMGGQIQQQNATPYSTASNQLVRRNVNQQLARGPNYDVSVQDGWSSLGDGGQQEWEHVEDDEELQLKAAAAKREAQSKRPPKQIPPFIQKLSSFLDESNTDLIKWSEDGNSFIVLDEDEFAKKLIPELFKHNNYASFVRQLNMYGFHKKVGLSDNSMRASEKKAKSPSEYYNPYFKRGRPELLWLIQKPKNETASTKRKRGKNADQDQGSDDDTKREGDHDQAHVSDGGGFTGQQNDLVTLPRPEYAALRQEVMALQRSQKQIAQVLSRMRDENQQYYQQAKAFQAQNERHENSINAILTFLATFYSRSLEGHGNINGMFSHAIPNNQTQANVVDVGDYEAQSISRPRPARRPLALLPAPASAETTSPETVGSSVSPRTWNNEQRRSNPVQSHLKVPQQGGRVTSTHSSARSTPNPEIKDSPSTPDVNPLPESESSNDMMSVIHNVNASNNSNTGSLSSPKLDFNAALRHYENSSGHGPLTPEQRDNILSVMGNNAGLGGPGNNSSNAIISPTPTPLPSLEPYHATREELDRLYRQMQEQDSKVQDLASRLQPLSPSGSIPGLPAEYYSNGGEPSNFNLNSSDDFDVGNYLNTDYFPDYDNVPAAGFGDDIDFELPEDGAAGAVDTDADVDLFGDGGGGPQLDEEEHSGAGRVVGSVGTSSGVQSPANNTTATGDEENDEDEHEHEEDRDGEVEAGTQTPGKRRRLRK